MRLSYLAQDRPDLLVLSKGTCKGTEESYYRSLEDAQAWCKVSSILSEDDSPISESESFLETI